MAKYLAQIVMLGAQVVGRAFSRALRQEFAASQSAANQRRSNNGSNDRVINAKLGMSLQEAMQILNIEGKEINRELTDKKYQHLYEVNDKAKGGSFYLQSKVVRAKERIDEELKGINPNESTTSDQNSERKQSENQ